MFERLYMMYIFFFFWFFNKFGWVILNKLKFLKIFFRDIILKFKNGF